MIKSAFKHLIIIALIFFSLNAFAQTNTIKSFDDVITAKAVRHKGFINIYEQDGKYLAEIPNNMLNREIMVINNVIKTNINSGDILPGDQIGKEKVIRFERSAGNKIDMQVMNYSTYIKDTTSQLYPSLKNAMLQSTASTFDIQAGGNNKDGFVVDLTGLITSGGAIFNSSTTNVTGVLTDSNTIQIKAYRSVQGASDLLEVVSVMYLLSEKPMQARYFDERIGYFYTSYTDFESNLQQIKNVSFACRWRLEPKDQDLEKYKRGELVEPKQPIVVYMDPTTPKKWLQYFMQGVNDWEPVLEEAGFKNAIVAKRAPTKAEDSTWSLEACRAAIIYKPSNIANSLGPHIHDPRSGEIIQSHIIWDHNMVKFLHDTYFIQGSPTDLQARKMVFDDELMGRLIRSTIAHEIGHLLGLKHNLGASSTVPVEKLRDKAWLDVNGICPSIMDYTRFNYVAQPEDKVGREGLFKRIGVYDKWAIEWGYRLYPQFKTADEEKPYLNKIVMNRLKDHRFWWGSGEIPPLNDPRSLTEDLGDNAMKASEYGIKNLQVVVNNLINWTKVPDSDYDNLTDMYHEILNIAASGTPSGQFNLYVYHVAANIGGVYRTPRVVEDTEPVYSYIPKAKQKEAVEFLNRQLFATPYWLINKDIFNRTGDNPLFLIGSLQKDILENVINTSIHKVSGQQAIASPDEIYAPAELFDDVSKGIWGELVTHNIIDIYRRELQKGYLNILAKMLEYPDTTDAESTVRPALSNLKIQVEQALPFAKDTTTKLHLEDVLHRINTILSK